MKPISYDTLIDADFCAYDAFGNLFVDGYDNQNSSLSEMPKGAEAFTKLSVNQNVGQPGQVQWDGKYLSYEDTQGNHGNAKKGAISRLSVSGSEATIESQVILNKVPNRLGQSWIYEGSVIAL